MTPVSPLAVTLIKTAPQPSRASTMSVYLLCVSRTAIARSAQSVARVDVSSLIDVWVTPSVLQVSDASAVSVRLKGVASTVIVAMVSNAKQDAVSPIAVSMTLTAVQECSVSEACASLISLVEMRATVLMASHVLMDVVD